MMFIWASAVRHDIPFYFYFSPQGDLHRNFPSFVVTVFGGVHYKEKWYGLVD